MSLRSRVNECELKIMRARAECGRRSYVPEYGRTGKTGELSFTSTTARSTVNVTCRTASAESVAMTATDTTVSVSKSKELFVTRRFCPSMVNGDEADASANETVLPERSASVPSSVEHT